MKKIKNKIFIILIIAVALAISFFWGGNVDNIPDDNQSVSTISKTTDDVQIPDTEEAYNEAVKEIKPDTQPQESKADIKEKDYTCTLSVKCDTINNSIERFDSDKTHIIPQDGIIYAEQTVSFEDGETVFDILLREMKKNKIHLEFVNTPVYNSAYIEGIANIYEFDCGELSGWLYSVNGVFPNYGCSSYRLKPGDKVEWVYTLNLGADVGGEYSARNGREINE